MSKSTKLRNSAKILQAERQLDSPDEIEVLNAKADLAELQAMEETFVNTLIAAEEELRFIEECISKLQPYRKYSNLSDPEAHEAAQQEEWLQELIFRAQNYLLTTGTVHVDHFSTMRMHPEFSSRILPAIKETKGHIEAETIEQLFAPKAGTTQYALQSFLDSTSDRLLAAENSDHKLPETQ
jgi:hypothetical protein